MPITLHDITAALTPTGLLSLGGFKPEPADGVPGDDKERTLVLVGNAGPDMWRAFSATGVDDKEPDPLDHWTRRTLTGVADTLSRQFNTGVSALFPFDGPPYLPFQRWAVRTGIAHQTPIGPLIHQQYGMWHAYRGALLIQTTVAFDDTGKSASPCLSCAEKPCLSTCPVEAFSTQGYDVPKCLDLLEREPDGDCFSAGCRARRACPVGRDYIYEPVQARFHMEKFLIAHRP